MPTLGQRFSNALVTGGSRGFGAAFTRMLLSEGINVHILSRMPPADIPPSPKLHFTPIDLSQEADVLQWLEKVQQESIHFDLLINNAGAGAFYPFEDMPFDVMQSQLQLLLKTPILLTQVIYKDMRLRGKGTIVNISSLAVELPLPFMSLYNSAKAALSSLTESLILESYGAPIKILELRPGDFKTHFHESMQKSVAFNESNKVLVNAYSVMITHHEKAPLVTNCVKKLGKLLAQNKSGIYRLGSFFQARLASIVCRCIPIKFKLQLLRFHYRLSK